MGCPVDAHGLEGAASLSSPHEELVLGFQVDAVPSGALAGASLPPHHALDGIVPVAWPVKEAPVAGTALSLLTGPASCSKRCLAVHAGHWILMLERSNGGKARLPTTCIYAGS